MRTRVLIGLLIGGILALSLPGCTGGKDAKEEATQQENPRDQEAAHTHMGPRVGEKAPTFSLKDVKGTKVNMADMIGKKPLILVFWGTWCPHCVSEVPSLKRMEDRYKKEGAEVVSVAVRHPREKLEEFPKSTGDFVKTNEMNYTVLLDGESEFPEAFRAKGRPGLPATGADEFYRDLNESVLGHGFFS